MTTARQFLDLIRAFELFKSAKIDPEEALTNLSDSQFRIALSASAELFRTMKKEAIRRGIWEDIIQKARSKK